MDTPWTFSRSEEQSSFARLWVSVRNICQNLRAHTMEFVGIVRNEHAYARAVIWTRTCATYMRSVNCMTGNSLPQSRNKQYRKATTTRKLLPWQQ